MKNLKKRTAMEENKQKIEDECVTISGRKLECIILLAMLWWMISVGAAFILGVCLNN